MKSLVEYRQKIASRDTVHSNSGNDFSLIYEQNFKFLQ